MTSYIGLAFAVKIMGVEHPCCTPIPIKRCLACKLSIESDIKEVIWLIFGWHSFYASLAHMNHLVNSLLYLMAWSFMYRDIRRAPEDPQSLLNLISRLDPELTGSQLLSSKDRCSLKII